MLIGTDSLHSRLVCFGSKLCSLAMLGMLMFERDGSELARFRDMADLLIFPASLLLAMMYVLRAVKLSFIIPRR